MAEPRLNSRVRALLDAPDNVQEAFLDVAHEHDERPRNVDTLFVLARRPRGKPPGALHPGLAG